MNVRQLLAFARQNWLPTSVFVIALAAFLLFSGRFVADFIYFNDPKHQDQALKGWMTPRYIGMSYSLPKDVVFDALGLEEKQKGPRKHMRDIAAEKGMTLDEMTEVVRQAAEEFREKRK